MRNLLAAAGMTVMPNYESLTPTITLSLTVSDCVPAVFRVALKVCTPASAAGKGESGGGAARPAGPGKGAGAGEAGGVAPDAGVGVTGRSAARPPRVDAGRRPRVRRR